MTYKCALLCMHGMGNLYLSDFQLVIARLKQNLSTRLPASRFSEIYIPESGIFYSSLTQKDEDDVWKAMENTGGLNTGIVRKNTVNRIRRFILSGFSDATAFIGFNSTTALQQYMNAQFVIHEALQNIYNQCGEVPIIILSQSLGSQILSSYIWDAQTSNLGSPYRSRIDPRSIWNTLPPQKHDNFLRLQTLSTWVSTGCNIPVFVSGFNNVRAVHNRKQGYNFTWFNYYDYDDVLGYPLKPLDALFVEDSTQYGQSYKDAVTDIQINANKGSLGAVTSGWNPLSHTQYWDDKKLLDDLATMLK